MSNRRSPIRLLPIIFAGSPIRLLPIIFAGSTIQLIPIAFAVGVALENGLKTGFQQNQPELSQGYLFSLVEYHRLLPGMDLTKVESILGKGIEIESTPNTSTHIWSQSPDSHITLFFKHGRLERKTQKNLK